MIEILYARKRKRGRYSLIDAEHALTSGATVPITFVAVCGGLAWPIGAKEMHAVIIGEEYDHRDFADDSRRGKMHILADLDLKGAGLETAFQKITDAVALTACDFVYADASDEFLDFVRAYEGFCRKKNFALGRLEEAPFCHAFGVGTRMIQDLLTTGRLEIPKDSLVHQELSNISLAEMEGTPEKQFPAINALRFAVGALKKFKPVKRWRRKYVSPRAI